MIVRKIQKDAITFDLCRHAKSSLTATTVFISSTKFAIKGFSLLKGISGNICNIHPLRCLQLTSDRPKKSRSFLQYGVFPIFKARFFITTNLMSSIKISI